MGRVSIRFDGDNSGAKRSVRELGQEIDRLVDRTSRSFSQEGLAEYVAGLDAVGIAVQGLTALYREFDEVSREALSRLEGARASTGALAQLAGSKEEFDTLSGSARQFSTISGQDISAANRAVFSISSAGFGPSDVGAFARAQTIDIDAATTARSLATLRGTLGSSGLGVEGDISQLIAASAVSPAGAGEIAEGASRSGALAARLGIGRPELLSAEAILATATGSPERGATQLQALLKSAVAEEDRFRGKGLLGIVQEISRGGIGETGGDTSGPGLQKGFGRAEGFLGFAALQANQVQLQQTISSVEAAGGGQAFRDKLSFIGANQTAAAVGELQSSRQALNQADEDLGRLRAQGEAAFNRRQASRASSGNLLGRLAAGALPDAVTAAGGDVAAGLAADISTQGVGVTLLSKIANLLEEVAQNTNETAKKTTGTVGLARPGADE